MFYINTFWEKKRNSFVGKNGQCLTSVSNILSTQEQTHYNVLFGAVESTVWIKTNNTAVIIININIFTNNILLTAGKNNVDEHSVISVLFVL